MHFTNIEKLKKESFEKKKKENLSKILEGIYVKYAKTLPTTPAKSIMLEIILNYYDQFNSSFEKDFRKLYEKCQKIKNPIELLNIIETYISE